MVAGYPFLIVFIWVQGFRIADYPPVHNYYIGNGRVFKQHSHNLITLSCQVDVIPNTSLVIEIKGAPCVHILAAWCIDFSTCAPRGCMAFPHYEYLYIGMCKKKKKKKIF